MPPAAHPPRPVARTVLQESDIPLPVRAFVCAVNAADHAALVALFAPDALVNDQLRDFWGLAAIAGWMQEEVVGVQLVLTVLAAVRHFDAIVLTAEVGGDFDKTGLPVPLVLDFHFSLDADRICRLIVLSRLQTDALPEIRVPPRGKV